LDHLAADRKKVILAVGLVAVMVIMWVRLLTGKKPGVTSAAPEQTQSAGTKKAPPMKLQFHELPVIEGRNDRIHRDFFSADGLAAFRQDPASQDTGTDTEVRNGTGSRNEEVILRVARKGLRLEAVLEGPRAFMNDRLVSVGDRLSVKDGPTSYVFEVIEIQDDSVLVGCNGEQVTLRLTQTSDETK
jgi:hypothetical protein